MKSSVNDIKASSLPTQKGFSNRVLSVALVATLIPTLVLAIALVSNQKPETMQSGLVLILFILLAVATVAYWEVKNILRPVEVLTHFVQHYVSTGEIEDVPEAMDQELGGLIQNTRNAIVKLDLANKELAVASRLDLLTGLPNRGFSSQRLEQDLSRARRTLTPVTVVSIDVDGFKQLNDKFGLSVGDACLRYYADLAKTCIRDGDWIARWGADEFLILLWDAEYQHAEDVINRIRYKLSHSAEAEDAGVRFTASYGYASHEIGERPNELLARVENARGRAQKFGRNQAAAPSGISLMH